MKNIVNCNALQVELWKNGRCSFLDPLFLFLFIAGKDYLPCNWLSYINQMSFYWLLLVAPGVLCLFFVWALVSGKSETLIEIVNELSFFFLNIQSFEICCRYCKQIYHPNYAMPFLSRVTSKFEIDLFK